MTKAEILAALRQLLSKADFTAAVNALATWVQGKFTTLKAYVDTQVAAVTAQVQAVYRPSGDIAPSGLVAGLLVVANLGKVYHLTADATTTADWKEGAGKTVVAGTDVGIVEVSTDSYSQSADTEVDGDKTYYSDDQGTAVDKTAEGYAEKNPTTEGWYEKTTTLSYKFNSFAGMVDLSNYLQPEDFETIGTTEAANIVAAAIAAAEA